MSIFCINDCELLCLKVLWPSYLGKRMILMKVYFKEVSFQCEKNIKMFYCFRKSEEEI